MKPENKTILIKRLKSFAWRTGMMLLALFVAFIADNLKLFELSPDVVVVLGLFLGELSKYFNTQSTKYGKIR